MKKPELEKSWNEKVIILIATIVPFVATLYAIVLLWERYVTPLDLVLLLSLILLTGQGVTVGFHRMLTHRSFETHPVIKALFLILGTMAFETSPIMWASTHIEHHANSDQEGDPHSPFVSLWHAHIGWFFTHTPNIDKYGKWLKKDAVVVWVDRTYLLWLVLSLAIPFAIGGWSGLLWGGLVRIFIVHHGTWSVNSICHAFGTRPFATPDASRNNWIVAFVSMGEGWHNNHHAFPHSAFHGLRWWQLDISGYFIRGLELLGLVWNVQRVRLEDELKRQGMMVE